MNCYKIFKRTSTHSDVLAALGAADLLKHLSPRVVEFDDRFEVQLQRELRSSDLDSVEPGFDFFEGSQKTSPDVRKTKRSSTSDSTNTGAEAIPDLLHTDRMNSVLRRMNAQGGPNKVSLRFQKLDRETWRDAVWASLHGALHFMPPSPLVQLFNPQSCRGYALMKPSGTNRRDKTKDRWAEPFLEWLRYRGYFAGSAAWFTCGDLRLYCPVPGDISFKQFATTVAAFRNLPLGGTAVKVDCRAVLGLTRLLVQNAERYERPRRALRGVWVTHYKDMGKVHTFMAMDQLALPDWFELRSAEQAEMWLRTLEEHDTVVRRLNDSHSDEFALLKHYRRTFQLRWQDSVVEFVEFLMNYGLLLFRRRANEHWLLPQFSVSRISPILRRDPHLRVILRNAGFIAVAAAVRGSTVGAQAARHHGRPDHREIRYGLLSELRRAALAGKQELSEVLSSFVQEFNRESARRRGSGRQSRTIEPGEIEAFLILLERSASALLVGSLVCGFATCIPGEAAFLKSEQEARQAIPA